MVTPSHCLIGKKRDSIRTNRYWTSGWMFLFRLNLDYVTLALGLVFPVSRD
jgi:hypothetical protein